MQSLPGVVAEFGANLVLATTEVRRRANLRRPSFSTAAIIEACFPGTLVTGGDLPDGIHEAVKRTKDGPIIVYSRSLPGPDQRFAIAHALAHLIYDGHREACRIGHAGDLYAEYRADEFAAELLAPVAMIAKRVTRFPSQDPREHHLFQDEVDQIASVFAVPAYVVDQRIRLLVSGC